MVLEKTLEIASQGNTRTSSKDKILGPPPFSPIYPNTALFLILFKFF